MVCDGGGVGGGSGSVQCVPWLSWVCASSQPFWGVGEFQACYLPNDCDMRMLLHAGWRLVLVLRFLRGHGGHISLVPYVADSCLFLPVMRLRVPVVTWSNTDGPERNSLWYFN